MAKNIRVGLIHCDTHGLWYGPLMAAHDPLLLQRPMDPLEKHRHSWQTGVCHQFFYTDRDHPTQMTVPHVGGFEFVKLWDEDRAAAEQAKAIFLDKPVICDSPEEVSDDVDQVFIANSNGDGEAHVDLAAPGLKKGVSTFVDKPICNTVEKARSIVAMGRAHNALVFSLSILRVEPAIADFRRRFSDVGELSFATIGGYGSTYAAMVHNVAACHQLYGDGIQTVQVIGNERHESILLDYGERDDRPRHGVMIHCTTGSRRFAPLYLNAYGSQGDVGATVLGQYAYPFGTVEIIRMLQRMCERKRLVPPMPLLLEQMIESIAVCQATRQAQRIGLAVNVSDYLKD